MTAVEAASAHVLVQSVPYTHKPFYNEPGHYAPHVDGNFRGIALHQNHAGNGRVQLAHLTDDRQPGKAPIIFQYRGEGTRNVYTGPGMSSLANHSEPLGVIHEGRLVPGRITAHSQGNIDGMKPSVHYYDRTESTGWWTRYDSSLKDADKDPGALAEEAKHYKLGIQGSEHYKASQDPATSPSALRRHHGRNVVSNGLDDKKGYVTYRQAGRAERFVDALRNLRPSK